jgi:methylated-DNA-protein-cysteine methyltransferase related protein
MCPSQSAANCYLYPVMAKKIVKKDSKRKVQQVAAPAKDTAAKSYSFFDDVYAVVRQIPKGRVTSYGAIANYLGTKLSARMVGWAMNASFNAKPRVPAQRVVNRNGMLSGKHHFGTPTLMEELLKKDGVMVKDEKIIGFDKHFWDPATELGL